MILALLALTPRRADSEDMRRDGAHPHGSRADGVTRRLGRSLVVVLVVGAIVATVSGSVQALAGPDSTAPPPVDRPTVEECPNPPCLPESWPDLASLPTAAPTMIAGLALLLGLFVLGVTLIKTRHGDARHRAGTGLLMAAVPVLVLVGSELVPHLVTPCWVELPGMCIRTEEHGVEYVDHLHLLGHAVFGWVPLTALAWWLVGRWRPELLPGLRRRP